jgi:hypothetical protein
MTEVYWRDHAACLEVGPVPPGSSVVSCQQGKLLRVRTVVA